MLDNAGFEGAGHGEWTRDTHDGVEYGNWFTPIGGWVGWWNPRQARPEAHVISFEPPFVGPPARVYEGHYACKLHKSFDDWTGGHYQVVEGLTPGALYRTGFYAHAWANHQGLPHDGEADCAPMGCGPLYRLESELPPLNGDPVNDAWWAARFQVGVQFLSTGQNPDPTYNVLWGEAAAIYNAYAPVPTLSFEAEKPRAAIYLRAAFLWDYRNNDAYLDSAFLEALEPPPSREYSRTYVLWPDGAGTAEQHRITALHPGRTCGPSADDAAIDHPFLKDATIISYQPQTWPGGKAGLEAFWREYYDFPAPQDAIIYHEDDAPPPVNPILLWQRDPEWKDIGFGDANCHSTIGQQGCFITDLAMAQRFYGIQDDATPLSVDEALGPAGYNGCIANWVGNNGHFEDVLQIGVSRGTEEQAIVHMLNGGCVMAEVEPPEREHFVLVYEGLDWMALDPWTNEERVFQLDDAQSWRILTHVEEPVPPPPQGEHIGIHMQSQDGDWLAYARVTQGPMKFLNHWTELLQSKRAGTPLPIYRHWVSEQPIGVPDKDALMRDYINRFIDDMTNVCAILTNEGFMPPFFGVEGFNETYACWADSLPDAIECDRAFVRQLVLTGLPVVPVPFCAAVGNPQLPSEDVGGPTWPHILQLAQETEAQGGLFGYHAYWFANPNESGLVSDWPWLAGRWTLFDDYLRANGVHVGWFFGECGAVGGHAWPNGGYNLLPQDGWLASTCYQGNWQRYEDDLIRFNDMVAAWNTTHGNRALGGTIFTTGGWDWEKFLIRGSQMTAIANALQSP